MPSLRAVRQEGIRVGKAGLGAAGQAGCANVQNRLGSYSDESQAAREGSGGGRGAARHGTGGG